MKYWVKFDNEDPVLMSAETAIQLLENLIIFVGMSPGREL